MPQFSQSAAPGMSSARPPWLPTLAALLVAALTTSLGEWQSQRAETKQALGAMYERARQLPALNWAQVQAIGESARYRRLRISGEFDPAFQIWLDNRVHQGRAGYHLILPLRLDDGASLLVNRGWHAANADRGQLPSPATPSARQTLEGILIPAQSRYLELAQATPAEPVWQNLDLDRYRAWFDSSLPDWLLLQTSPADDGLTRDWPQPDVGVTRHRIYAAQWYSLAALSVGLWLYFVVLTKKAVG